MKGILLFALILFTSFSFAQSYLSGSSSSLSFAPQEKYVKFSITDSLDSSTDTCMVYVKDGSGNSYRTGCEDLRTGEIVDVLIPGNGAEGRYLINEPFPVSVIITRTNVLNLTRRTKVWWSSVGSQ